MPALTWSLYYKRLTKMALWPLIGFIGLIVVIVVSEILILHFIYVPDLLAPFEQLLSTEGLIFLASGINKIILHLSVWIMATLLVNIFFAYCLWNVKKLLVEVARVAPENQDRENPGGSE